MQLSKVLTSLLLMGLCNLALAQAPGGGGHAGHGGHGGGANPDDFACFKAKISHFKPEHLATVAPGADFSFYVSGPSSGSQIHVSIRQQPIKVDIEDKETFFLVKGKLPPEYKNEVVRVSVKAITKSTKCDAEGGLLLKVSE